MSEYVDALNKELLEKGSVFIEEVGTLSKISDGDLSFKALGRHQLQHPVFRPTLC